MLCKNNEKYYRTIVDGKGEIQEEQVGCVYSVLNKLREYKLFNELLLPARSKKEVEVFDIREKSIERLILSFYACFTSNMNLKQ